MIGDKPDSHLDSMQTFNLISNIRLDPLSNHKAWKTNLPSIACQNKFQRQNKTVT